jgi:hypothetical protein
MIITWQVSPAVYCVLSTHTAGFTGDVGHARGLNLNSVNQLIFVMVKYGVPFEVRTEFLNNI